MIDGYKVAIAVMDFSFLAATMGSVVGERITRVIEFGTAKKPPSSSWRLPAARACTKEC